MSAEDRARIRAALPFITTTPSTDAAVAAIEALMVPEPEPAPTEPGAQHVLDVRARTPLGHLMKMRWVISEQNVQAARAYGDDIRRRTLHTLVDRLMDDLDRREARNHEQEQP